MEVESILKALERYDGTFPREALEQAIAQPDAVTPHLLEALRYARENVDNLPDHYYLHTWAMYLLAQFRETRAYPLVVALLDLPRHQLDLLHGDLITEDALQILASVSGGDSSLIEGLIERPEVNEYVRDAAMGAVVCLVATGQRTREEVLEYFRRLFHTAKAKRGSFFWAALVYRSSVLYPDLVLAEIECAYRTLDLDPLFMSMEDIQRVLSRGKDAVLADLVSPRSDYRLIDDTIRETEWWAAFRPAPSPPRTLERPALISPLAPIPTRQAPQISRPLQAAVKPERNSPCPCGSGLKYKKCCLKKATG